MSKDSTNRLRNQIDALDGYQQDLEELVEVLAHRARCFPNYPMGYHMPELFAALGEEPPQPASAGHDSDCAMHNAPAYPPGACDCTLAQPAQQANDNEDALTLLSDAKRLYVAVEKMCMQAGTDTTETVEWLCGPYGGMAKLFSSHFSPDTKTQSFGEKYPRSPDAKCKCEHWEACIDCHPTYINAAMKGDV